MNASPQIVLGDCSALPPVGRSAAVVQPFQPVSLGVVLTRAQIEHRTRLAAETLFPIPDDPSSLTLFLGWTRYDWMYAPEELARAVGLAEAWRRWNQERTASIARRRRRKAAALKKTG